LCIKTKPKKQGSKSDVNNSKVLILKILINNITKANLALVDTPNNVKFTKIEFIIPIPVPIMLDIINDIVVKIYFVGEFIFFYKI